MRRFVRLAVFLSILSACTATTDGVLENNRVGPRAPRGTTHITEAVDGLVVGHRLMTASQFELALAAYTRALQEHGLTSDVLSAIGSANMRLGRLGQAEKFLKTAVERDPDFVPAWNNLGVVQINLGKNQQARASFRRAFALDNGNSDEIRANLILAIALDEANSAEFPEFTDFLLVRRGNGRYLLLGQN
ncbi:MAG: tetratricopeptide repeat protein [Rhodobacteraceae bacterium]|nr:tetratricopeptide repeat protein [Paracoccaceae bacterium]